MLTPLALLFTLALLALPSAAAGSPEGGRLIDVGGARLHLHCLGGVGPTVVIDAGAGAWSIHYRHIQETLAPHVRICTYDRAGLGKSDEIGGGRSSSEMADELHRLLHAAGLEPPFVLAGHSLGGYNVRVYQRRYGAEVAALVLIDSAHPEQWRRLPPVAYQLVQAAVPGLRATATAAERGDLTKEQIPAWPEAYDPELRNDYDTAMLAASTYRTRAAEFEGAERSASAVPSGSLGDLPLVVVTAGNSFAAFEGTGIPIVEANAIWLELQRELVALSRDTVQLSSETGTHALGETDPGIVVEGIRLAVDKARVNPDVRPLPADPHHRLPLRSTPAVDQMLREIEEAYRSMDAEAFVGLFTTDVEQLDVDRRVLIRGAEAWLDQTRRVNSAHRWMERIHHGRLVAEDRIVVEIEWAGSVRGEAVGSPSDVEYRYTGLGVLEIEGREVRRQLLYSDAGSLTQQLGLPRPESWTIRETARSTP